MRELDERGEAGWREPEDAEGAGDGADGAGSPAGGRVEGAGEEGREEAVGGCGRQDQGEEEGLKVDGE